MIFDIDQLAELKHLGCMFSDISNDVFQNLKVETSSLENNQKMISGLTSNGVATHYHFNQTDSFKQFQYFIESKVQKYLRLFPKYINEFDIFSDDVPIMLDKPWFNIQKNHEFIPNHNHTGFLSYSGWIQVPFERSQIQGASSCFEFIYPSVGRLKTLPLHVDRSFEGKIMFFPSALMHCVYPFYNSDIPRISFSGNIMFDTSKTKKSV